MTEMTFECILERIVKDNNISNTKREQGTLFERVIKKILQVEPRFKNEYKEVYLWSEFNIKFGVDSGDMGIDLMALTHDEKWVSIQCKCFDIKRELYQNDLKNFLGINNITKANREIFSDISQKLIFCTCKNISSNVYEAIDRAKSSTSDAKIYDFYALQSLDIDWQNFQIEDLNALKTNTKKELRDYQKDALKAIKESFITRGEQRAKIIMACGTGKSLLSIRTIDELVANNELALFLAPSLALINQMLMEFFYESKSESYKLFAVCSDKKVGSNISEDMDSKDMIIPVISNPQDLSNRITAYQSKCKVIIFSTYNSIDIVIEAQKIFSKEFKLVICDEAHRTAGAQKLDSEGNKKEISFWQKVHYSDNINAKHRLYMTATPRIYSEKAKEKLDTIAKKSQSEDLMLFSMDDKTIFGDEIYKLTFDKAISLGILSDYRVIISFISEESLNEILADATHAKENPNLSFEDAGKMVSLVKALKKEHTFLIDENGIMENEHLDKAPMRRAVCFHSSIKNSKFVTANFYKVSQDIAPKHIDGNDNANIKYQKLQWLKEDDEKYQCKILNNAKCLTEGIDVPNLDAVAFFDPRDSVVDTVQAVGRAIRKSENKKYGYIILPIVLSDEEIKDYEKTIKSTKFKGIWKVLKALRSHDERLIDEARINEVVITSLSTSSDLKDLPEATLFPLEALFSGIKNAIPKQLGDLQYWETYANKVGDIMQKLISRIEHLIDTRDDIATLFSRFCNALRANLNSSFDTSEAITLIAQHIITKPIFNHIFPHLDFASFDKVACELENLYTELDKLGLSAEIKDLEKFYTSIQKNAEYAQSDKSKQDLIRNLYDSLFKSAFKKTQEKLGIVYTPIEVVDFIIHSVQYALNKHFGKSLGDKGIHIYDPFTGTGSFITRLIQSGLLDSNLAHKYENEIWANEITLLGYYIAQINITATYHKQILSLHSPSIARGDSTLSPSLAEGDKGGGYDSTQNTPDSSLTQSQNATPQYKLLDNLLFTDTFNTYTHDTKGFKGQGDLLSTIEYLKANFTKIQELKQTDFKVIFGNPPYSANQKRANDNNANITYEALEQRVQDTYIAKSISTYKGKVYDTLKMAIRYASDRIENTGIVAFVTNSSFINSESDDGLRACLEAEFDYIYIFNLRGNQRTSGELSRKEGGKIFDSGSRTPVAISLFIKCDDTSSLRGAQSEASATKQSTKAECAKAKIFYYDIGDYLDRQTKLNIIQNFRSIEGIERQSKWQIIHPNKDYDWINQRDYSYLDFMPLGDIKTKLKNLQRDSKGKLQLEVFKIYSQGILTSRDAWCVNFSLSNLESNMRFMIDNYNKEVAKKETDSTYKPTMDKSKINWSRALTNDFNKKLKFDFNDNGLIVSSHYRPFTKCHLYLAKHFNEMLYQMPQIYPTPQTKDINILDCGVETEAFIKDFYQTHRYLPNLTICISGIGSSKDFSTIITNQISEYALLNNSQCFPLHYYESDCFKPSKDISTYYRKDAIRDEALHAIQGIYKDSNITKESIFYYIYALLNHNGYKQKYKDNLSKMLPRIPFTKDFWAYKKLGRELANLHLEYESFAKCSRALAIPKDKISLFSGIFGTNSEAKSKDLLSELEPKDFTIKKMAFEKKGQKDIIIFNDKIAIVNIPPKAYNYIVNGKSAIEWIMERYQVKIDKDSGIKNDPNLYECKSGALAGLNGGKYALYLLLSVIEMSAQSVEIIEAISELDFSEVEK